MIQDLSKRIGTLLEILHQNHALIMLDNFNAFEKKTVVCLHAEDEMIIAKLGDYLILFAFYMAAFCCILLCTPIKYMKCIKAEIDGYKYI